MDLNYSLLIKPVSGQCNLNCGYCFYRHKKAEGPVKAMGPEILNRMIGDYMADVPRASFSWQGGEPTLAGLDFYGKVLELQKSHKRPGQTVTNTLQTNGTLLTPEWARFLAENRFLVGLSIDGRQQDHDRHRRSESGSGSFSRVMYGKDLLLRYRAEYNILTVITPENVRNPWKLYSTLKKYGTAYLQFIPLMESPEVTDGTSTTLSPEEYGRFLCETFDYWYADLGSAKPISIRTFDNAVGLSAKIPSEICTFHRGCPVSPVIEANGDVYPCDFSVTPEWRLGNLMETPLGVLVRGEVMTGFTSSAMDIPEGCRVCRWNTLCNGGCLAERLFVKNKGTASYYCSSYRAFFEHASERLTAIAGHVMRNEMD